MDKRKRIVLYFAPMCHLSGHCIRQLVRLYHPGTQFMTQMYSCTGILNSNIAQTIKDNVFPDELEDTYIQLYASSNEDFVAGIKKLMEKLAGLKYINLNLGCPAGCAQKERYGYYYGDDQYGLIKMLRESFPGLVVSLKIRLKDDLDAYIRACRENSIDSLVVHCRRGALENTRAQALECNFSALSKALFAATPSESHSKLSIIINGGIQSIQHAAYINSEFFNGEIDDFMIGVGFLHNPRLGILWEPNIGPGTWGKVYMSKEQIGRELPEYTYICFLDTEEIYMLKGFIHFIEDSEKTGQNYPITHIFLKIYDTIIQNSKALSYHHLNQDDIIEKLNEQVCELQKLQSLDNLQAIAQQNKVLCYLYKYNKASDIISLIYYLLFNIIEHKETIKELQRYTQFLGNKIQQDRVTYENMNTILYDIIKNKLQKYLSQNLYAVVEKNSQ